MGRESSVLSHLTVAPPSRLNDGSLVLVSCLSGGYKFASVLRCVGVVNVFNFCIFFRVRIHNKPIPVKYPEQADEGLWGGEGFIEGLRKKKDKIKIPGYVSF